MTEIKWDTTKEDRKIIIQIAERAVKTAKKQGAAYLLIDAVMDISACHLNGNPLRLAELLQADNGNFGHDVFGIQEHMDRKTGKLTRCFVPRFSR